MPDSKNKKSVLLKEKPAFYTGEADYLNKFYCSPLEKNQRIYRLYIAARCRTAEELADFLDIKLAKKLGEEWVPVI